MTAEPRTEWICTECGVRERRVKDVPFVPSRWQDGVCYSCVTYEDRMNEKVDKAAVKAAAVEQVEAALTEDPKSDNADLAKRFNVSKGTVSTARKKLGIPLRKPSEMAERKEKVAQMLTEQPDLSASEIARQVGVTPKTALRVQRELRAAGTLP